MSAQTPPSLSTLRLIDNYDRFTRLSEKMQARITHRLEWVHAILAVPHGKKGQVVSKAAEELKVSIPTVHRFVKAYRKGGWEALCDTRGATAQSLPPEFKDYVCELHLQCQRSTTGREVHRMLIERWRKWQRSGEEKHAIPGYETPPPAGSKGFPRGWSEDNILRFQPDRYALTAVRQGAKSAAVFLPSILKTRVGMKFGQVFFFDDQQYDLKVVAPGTSQKAVRPLGFNCLEFLSGCFMHHAIRLRWWDKEHNKHRELTQQEFTWFVVAHLQKHGYRRDSLGTTLVFEHGTATGYNNKQLSTFGGCHSFDEALAAVSHGCIRVDRSGRFNQPIFAGMLFRPQSSGNPNFKAPLESMFNMVRNRMSALPGATGLNRDMKPAEQHGMDIYVRQLLKLWEELDERHRKTIIFPVPTAEQFGDAAEAVYQAINARTDHALEGWEKCGFVAPQLRFTPDERTPWMCQKEVAELPDDVRAMLLAKAETPGHVRPYRLTPADVARQFASELTKLPDHMIPLLIPMQWARTATVKEDRTISIKDQLLGPEAFQYTCRFEDRHGVRTLNPGTKLLCYLNPYNTERLVICKEDGSFIGTLHQRTRAGWLDQDAILEQLKERAEMKADLDAPVRGHLEGLMDERAETKRHNDRLDARKPVLPEELAKARAESARNGVRTRKANEISAALGNAALDPANLLPREDEDELQESFTPAANPFSTSLLLSPSHDDDYE